MIVEYTAIVAGGRGPDAWDNETTVSGENMTLREALDEIEKSLGGSGEVFAIERVLDA